MTSPKIIRSEETSIPHGTEYQMEMEMPGPDGATVRIVQFMRKIDMGDAYTILNHVARGASPAQTVLTTGIKGVIDGNHRKDRIEVVLLGIDGTATKLETKEVDVLLNNPYQGLNLQETLEKFVAEGPPLRVPNAERD